LTWPDAISHRPDRFRPPSSFAVTGRPRSTPAGVSVVTRLLEDVNAAWGSVDNAPGVEPWESVLDRARVALAEAGTRAMDGPVVLVSHDAINSALLAFLEPTRWSEPGAVPQPTGCLNILQREGDTWAVVVAGRPPPLATRDVVGT